MQPCSLLNPEEREDFLVCVCFLAVSIAFHFINPQQRAMLAQPIRGLRCSMLCGLRSPILHARARALTSPMPQTNIGYVRLAFNVGHDDHIALRARVFDTPTGRSFLESCPHSVGSLQSYGDEVYGPLKGPLSTTHPQPEIPSNPRRSPSEPSLA